MIKHRYTELKRHFFSEWIKSLEYVAEWYTFGNKDTEYFQNKTGTRKKKMGLFIWRPSPPLQTYICNIGYCRR